MSAAERKAAPSLPLSDSLARIAVTRPADGVFPMDAALEQRGPERYTTRRAPFAEVLATWAAMIAGERLADVTIPSLFNLAVDYRDGALTRGGGGMAYTPHAWSQLVSLFKVNKSAIPDGIASVDRWHSPLTRHHCFEDIKRASRRPQAEECVLRAFVTTREGRSYPTVRAVVSGRHGLKDTDDSNVIRVLQQLEELPVEGRVSRGWDQTYGSFVLDSGDSDVRLGFAFSNSETGCGSIAFNGSITIRALDVEVMLPEGQRFEHLVTIASAANGTRRRHTLPRYDSRSGRRLSDSQRTAIAANRIGEDVDKALNGARVLAQRWGLARADVLPIAVKVATVAGDDAGAAVLQDVLCEAGYEHVFTALNKEGLKELAKVIADNSRLMSLPHGSAAHMAAALALMAVSKERTWEETRELQALSGQFVMEGWKR